MTDSLKNLLPVPSLEKAKRILCIQPHPDDNEIGAGACIAKLIQGGANAGFLTVTDGRMGTENPDLSWQELIRLRRKEGEEGGKILGVKDFFRLDYPDGGTLPLHEVRDSIVKVIRRFKPDALMAPDPWLTYEAHSDHRTVGLAAAEAFLFSGFPLCCPGHSNEGIKTHKAEFIAFYTTARPNTFIDVEKTWHLKLDAIKKHKSQFDSQLFEFLGVYLTAKGRALAAGTGFEIVEAFKVLTPMHLHFFEFTEDC